MTNNPEKIKIIEDSDINFNSRIPLQIKSNLSSASYLKTKKDFFGHLLDDENS